MATLVIDNKMLLHQFGAALDMLGNAIHACPPDLWEAQLWPDQSDQWVAVGFSSFWYLSYHTLIWTDIYLTGTEEGFQPPAPFQVTEIRANESLPRVYTCAELLTYLDHCRQRCTTTLSALTPEQASHVCRFGWGQVAFAELQLYNLRHVQEHAAHLNMFLGQHGITASRWVARTDAKG